MNMKNGLEKVGAPLLFWAVTVSALVLGFWVRGMMTRPEPPTVAPTPGRQ